MGNHWRVNELRAQLKSEGGDISGRHSRRSWSLPVFASFVTFAFLLVTAAPPTFSPPADAAVATADDSDLQSFSVNGDYQREVKRDTFTASDARHPAPSFDTPDPGSAKAIAWDILQQKGLGENEFACLVSLWDRESHWNVYASNPTSGAYGIPQALPGTKMATVAADWKTNPATQIKWGLGYISQRYGTPCQAWGHSESVGWY